MLRVPSWLKDAFWPLYRRTGRAHALLLRLALIRVHGIAGGRARYARLPPGDLSPIDRDLRSDQQLLLRRSQRYGRIFKSQMRPRLLVAIVGNEAGRRFVAEHTDETTSRPKELDHLFPIGHLRGMRGAEHRHYRKLFIGALRPSLVSESDADLRSIVRGGLDRLAASGGVVAPPALIASLRSLTTNMMLRLFFGLRPAGTDTARFVDLYDRFSDGYAPAHRYDDGRVCVFKEIREELVGHIESLERHDSYVPSVLQQLITDRTLDETVIGNLIYMIESGRFDVYSLMRWILKYLAAAPHIMTALRSNERDPRLSTAVVLETLRLNQSEAIQRVLAADAEFEGFFLPAGSQVRICFWEGHKDRTKFPHPFDFDPHRFLARDVSLEEFAPFGLDTHRCVAADYVVELTRRFVEELSSRFDLTLLDDGTPRFGEYHWEPSDRFAVRIEPLTAPSA